MHLQDLPALGAPLEAGLFAGLTTTKDGHHHAVVLLPIKPEKPLTWKRAVSWAKKAGGELPTRPVAALLFANLKDQFDPQWHWCLEQLDGSYAWYQAFSTGLQDFDHESFEGRARAVRLIPLTA